MLIYSSSITPRLRYTCDFIGKELDNAFPIITNNLDEYLSYPGPKINYTEKDIDSTGLGIKPVSLLFENDLRPQEIECFTVNDYKAFFKTGGELSFDLLAAIFFLISRYEEYLQHEKDEYGRFPHRSSTAFTNDFLKIPLINIWLDHLKKILSSKFSGWVPRQATFTYLPTYDIDEAFAYKFKSEKRRIGATIRAFLKGDSENIRERKAVLSGSKQDPYDSFEVMDALHTQFGRLPYYFFLVADRTGRYDKNILPSVPAMQEIVRKHSSRYQVGLHPSWQSGDDPNLLAREKQTLEKLSGRSIIRSRQHYIRFDLPATYRSLITAGIREDYSMGYGSINGFRASVASPFYWYDLGEEKATSLEIFPFCFMEANSFFEQKMGPPQALEEMRQFYRVVKNVNGTFISIWHNTFLGTSKLFEGWYEIYKQFLSEIKD